MNKTIKQAERYEAPDLKVVILSAQRCIATSLQELDYQQETFDE